MGCVGQQKQQLEIEIEFSIQTIDKQILGRLATSTFCFNYKMLQAGSRVIGCSEQSVNI